jgi:hypothetical protein
MASVAFFDQKGEKKNRSKNEKTIVGNKKVN